MVLSQRWNFSDSVPTLRDVPRRVGKKKSQTNIRMLRGHSGAITALHCITKREVWDLVGDRDDAGFFISGSTDCTVRFSLDSKFMPSYILWPNGGVKIHSSYISLSYINSSHPSSKGAIDNILRSKKC